MRETIRRLSIIPTHSPAVPKMLREIEKTMQEVKMPKNTKQICISKLLFFPGDLISIFIRRL